MDLRQLRYFLQIVELGSLSRAAEALHVAQPALSLHLKRLEQEFGCQLLHRTARGVVPTESGRRLAQRAEQILFAATALADEVRGIEAAPAGPAVIGIPTSMGVILTVPLVMAVRERFPAIHLRVVEGLSGHMEEWISASQLDIALVFGTEAPVGVATQPLAHEGLSLVCPIDDTGLAGESRIDMDRVLELPLILPGHPHGVREEVERAAMMRRRQPHVVVEVDALDQIKALVAGGAGYTVLSHRFARHGPLADRLAAIPIHRPVIRRTIALAHATERPLSIAARAVRKVLIEHVAQHFGEARVTSGAASPGTRPTASPSDG